MRATSNTLHELYLSLSSINRPAATSVPGSSFDLQLMPAGRLAGCLRGVYVMAFQVHPFNC